MNKTAQVFLGLAIAIVFPVFVFYAGVTFIPTHETASSDYPIYPQQPANSTQPSYCQGVYNDTTGKYAGTNPVVCAQQQQQYNADQMAYDVKLKAYDLTFKTYQDKQKADQVYNDKVVVYRGFLGVAFGLLGLAAVLAVATIPALVYGLASGAGLTLLGAISATFTASTTDLQKLVAGVLFGLFVVLVVMALIFDQKFIDPPKLDVPLPSPEPLPQPAPVEASSPVSPSAEAPKMPVEPSAVIEPNEPISSVVGPKETSHWVEHNK